MQIVVYREAGTEFLDFFTATKVGAPSFAFFAMGGTRAVRIEVLLTPHLAKSARYEAPTFVAVKIPDRALLATHN